MALQIVVLSTAVGTMGAGERLVICMVPHVALQCLLPEEQDQTVMLFQVTLPNRKYLYWSFKMEASVLWENRNVQWILIFGEKLN